MHGLMGPPREPSRRRVAWEGGGARERSGECPKGVSHGVDFAPTKSRTNTGRHK